MRKEKEEEEDVRNFFSCRFILYTTVFNPQPHSRKEHRAVRHRTIAMATRKKVAELFSLLKFKGKMRKYAVMGRATCGSCEATSSKLPNSQFNDIVFRRQAYVSSTFLYLGKP